MVVAIQDSPLRRIKGRWNCSTSPRAVEAMAVSARGRFSRRRHSNSGFRQDWTD